MVASTSASKFAKTGLLFRTCLRVEAATGGILLKNVFLKISQNSKENLGARISFLIKLQVETCNFIKKETLTQVLSCKFC